MVSEPMPKSAENCERAICWLASQKRTTFRKRKPMKNQKQRFLTIAVFGIGALALQPETLRAAAPNSFVEHDLVSDIPGRADHFDANLANPWGVAFSPTGPFWISDNHAGVSTVYNGEGEA